MFFLLLFFIINASQLTHLKAPLKINILSFLTLRDKFKLSITQIDQEFGIIQQHRDEELERLMDEVLDNILTHDEVCTEICFEPRKMFQLYFQSEMDTSDPFQMDLCQLSHNFRLGFKEDVMDYFYFRVKKQNGMVCDMEINFQNCTVCIYENEECMGEMIIHPNDVVWISFYPQRKQIHFFNVILSYDENDEMNWVEGHYGYMSGNGGDLDIPGELYYEEIFESH